MLLTRRHRLGEVLARPATYIILDLPEVLLLAAYFLLVSLPEKRIFLYGESPFEPARMREWDLVLLPHFLLPQMPEAGVDLVFNANSFSEMDAVTAREYLHQIERVCRGYFMHINHAARFYWRVNAETVENLPATDLVPNPGLFRRVYRHRRVFGTAADRLLYRRYRCLHFAFL